MTTERNEILSKAGASRLWPLVSAALLILAVSIWLGFKMPRGLLTYQDELFTAERAREMLILGRDAVYYNFQPSFAKPPLQYWLTTLTLPHFDNSATAVRIWPLAYGLLTAVVVGWLAFLVAPDRRWLVPLSVAIFVSCSLFSTESTRALLDTGLMFFTASAIALAELARRRPVWWLGVAVACWLGTLQKLPLIFLVWLIIIVARLGIRPERAKLSARWVIAGVLLAIALVSIWPLMQYLRFGMPGARAFAGDDLSTLFGERQLGSRPYFEVLTSLIATGWAGGGLALAAALTFLFSRKSRAPALILEMSILSTTVVLLAVVFNFRAVRYVLPIVPCLAIVLAFFLHQLAERSEKMRTLTIGFVILLVVGGFVQAEIKMHHRGPDASPERRVAQKLGEIQVAGASTILVKAPPPAKRGLRSGPFYLFHGALRFPLNQYSIDKLREAPPPRPVVGVCRSRDFPAVQAVYPEAEIALALDQFTCWRTAQSGR